MKINNINLNDIYSVNYENKLVKLVYGRSKNPIWINKDFKLDENVASLAGLMPDGSLIKDLMRIYFHQEKDLRKVYLFKYLILELFNPKNKIFIRNNKGETFDVYINSQTLARFFYHIIEIPKSDEQMRIPKWIFNSSKKIKIAYLKQAFDMEGTILKKLHEIRFISKDKDFALDIQKLLSQLYIGSTVNERIGGINRTLQYRLSIYRKSNFIKFKDIGFSIPFNHNRFEQLKIKYSI